ncbi:GIY-YIG nuclease family protein [Patescibacteria group bacterium]|nr:GIY-YIG nuclease family protein [Patescibacteria group bacterium]MBU1722012.1 GIY-YIG nuclease family protein [Patescibacteria group bacterium]MBU1901238.1 GIY-YIG nuclease family protein [Patescibacteria group bacterium]
MWYVYIVECADKTLYTGVTTDVERRIQEHNGKKLGAKYTRPRQPVEVVYIKAYTGKKEATQEEYRIKQLSRKEKLALIQSI